MVLARMVMEHTQEVQALAPIHVSDTHMLLSGTDAETRQPCRFPDGRTQGFARRGQRKAAP